MAKLHPMLEPFSGSSTEPWDRMRAAHLLNRLTWGGTRDEIDRVVSLGARKAVDELLDFPDAPADELSQSDTPDLSNIEGYPKTFAERRDMFKGKSAEERMLLQQRLAQANQQALRQVAIWWIKRMVKGPYPAHEKLTFFWHGHFTTSAKDERSAWLMWQQNETWRQHAAGSFEKFVRAVSRDPAMLDFLNNQQNRKRHPNENYARELMELFTLGIGNYTEADIREGARAFTGWAHDGEAFIFRKFDHDDEPKTFMGRRGNFDGDDVISLILQNKSCAPYVASRLWTFYVNDEPDPAIIASLSDVFKNNSFELRPLLRTMFLSKAFYDTRNIGAQIKSPLQLVVGTMRKLGVPVPDYGRLYGAMEQMGQVPLMPPNVKGWPGGRTWINTSTLFVRQNTALWLAGGAPIDTGKRLKDAANKRQKNKTQIDIDLDQKPSEIVDEWLVSLIQRPVEEYRRRVLVEAVGDTPSEASVRNMINLILSMPEYQLC